MTTDDDRDAALLWEIHQLRREGYEVCLVGFFNAQGHPRVITTLDGNENVTAFLRDLLTEVEAAKVLEPGSAH